MSTTPYFTFVWTHGPGDALERAVPLLWHGAWMRDHGWTNPVHVVFLAGYDRVGSDYLAQLRQLGYAVWNEQPAFLAHQQALPSLQQLPIQDQYWNLRWLVLEDLHRHLAPSRTVIHLDGDVIFLDDPSRVAAPAEGKTYILQGCPFFAAITDPGWYAGWRRELEGFLRDPASYQRQAEVTRQTPRLPPQDFGNVTCYNPKELHDQDLMEFLIADGRLPQARTGDIMPPPYYWMQNPLFPLEWADAQGIATGSRFAEANGRWMIGDRILALAHLQKDFVRQTHRLHVLRQAGLERRLEPVLRYDPQERQPSRRGRLAARLLDLLIRSRRDDRRAAYDLLFRLSDGTGATLFSTLLNQGLSP